MATLLDFLVHLCYYHYWRMQTVQLRGLLAHFSAAAIAIAVVLSLTVPLCA